jgi:hypothetical protein
VRILALSEVGGVLAYVILGPRSFSCGAVASLRKPHMFCAIAGITLFLEIMFGLHIGNPLDIARKPWKYSSSFGPELPTSRLL